MQMLLSLIRRLLLVCSAHSRSHTHFRVITTRARSICGSECDTESDTHAHYSSAHSPRLQRSDCVLCLAATAFPLRSDKIKRAKSQLSPQCVYFYLCSLNEKTAKSLLHWVAMQLIHCLVYNFINIYSIN